MILICLLLIFLIVIVTLASITMCFNLYCITANNCALLFYSTSHHKHPKTTCQQEFAHNFLCKKDKDTKLGTSFLHLFFLYFLKFHTKISTLRFLSVCFIRVFQFSIFWNCFRVHLLPETRHSKTELSPRKHFQFHLLKSPYSELFENIGDEKSGQPHCGWL